jgi:hypothetical protein
MTTLAKIAANRRNAQLSTGPRSPTGKLAVARNAVRHGIFSRLPVVAGESPSEWDAHRTGVLDSLTPVGLLEITLAERAALLLWRLARLARYEAAATTAGVEDAGLPPPDVDPFAVAFFSPGHREEEHLKLTDRNLRTARKNYREFVEVAGLVRELGVAPEDEPVRRDIAELLLHYAHATAADCPLPRFEPVLYIEPGFLARIGVAGVAVKQVEWTAGLLRRGLDYYAEAVGSPPAEFRTEVWDTLRQREAAFGREVRRLEEEAVAITRRSERTRGRAANAALLQPEVIAERVMKYEKHLHSQLTSTLHELERFQLRRVGSAVLPPIVADVNVTVNGD